MKRPSCRMVSRGSYQGVPQWGITGSAEITPSRATAIRWAALGEDGLSALADAGQDY